MDSLIAESILATPNPTQADRLRAMAEELEWDADEDAFKAKLAVIAKPNVPAEALQPQKQSKD